MSSRQAALLVHSLAAPDREWVLSRLDGAEQERLRGLLSELGELGIPQDRRLVESALAQPTPRVAAIATMPVDDDGLVRHAGAQAIAGVLHREPTAFVRKLIACGDWPWLEDVASRLGIPSGSIAEGSAASPAFRRAAIGLLASRLREAGVAAQVPTRQLNTTTDPASPRPWMKRMQSMWRKPQ
ncbi:hypothetical protein [Piscinibacter terrae]|uniref:Uncharacterized protein n=1 Tax=Piscinibacter terrae TaxID=2496871 RepID=A0A3N7HXM7_9BURK|nr:hypothetical protein [Albitalea terrae]RQP26663.1 hypothetical protein DZC73_06610 [Albitalea terrae]